MRAVVATTLLSVFVGFVAAAGPRSQCVGKPSIHDLGGLLILNTYTEIYNVE
jgi:hypothetical protein